jgi:hypothetical protein
MPRLGKKYALEVEEISKSREEYQSESYRASGLPPAPAVMVEDEVAAQGPEISAEKLEAVIRRHLGLPLADA